MKDERFYPCNEREARILRTLTGDDLARYKELRNTGSYVMEALLRVDPKMHETEVSHAANS